jgi:hypothetical protein
LYDATPVFVFSLEQEVAASFSNAFSGCSGLGNIISGLEDRGAPAGKAPRAIKRKARLPSSKAAGKPKAKAKAAAPTEGVEAVEGAEAAPAHADPAEAAEAVEAVEADPPLKVTRKCVTSRAYHNAKKLAKTDGKSSEEQLAAAQKAYKDAGTKWDQEYA